MKVLLTIVIMWGAFLVQEVRAESSPVAPPSSTDTIDAADIGQAQAVSQDEMGQQSGRQGVVIDELTNTLNSTETSGSVGSNVLTSTATGTNIVSDNAFGATNGVATVIQNSGNQNVIQSSFILNLSVK